MNIGYARILGCQYSKNDEAVVYLSIKSLFRELEEAGYPDQDLRELNKSIYTSALTPISITEKLFKGFSFDIEKKISTEHITNILSKFNGSKSFTQGSKSFTQGSKSFTQNTHSELETLTIFLDYLTRCGYKIYAAIYLFNGDHYYFFNKLVFASTIKERQAKGAKHQTRADALHLDSYYRWSWRSWRSPSFSQ